MISTKHKRKICFTLAGIALLATCYFLGGSYLHKKSNNVFIIGSSGSGKTTTALYLLNKKLKHTDGHKIDLTDTNDPHHGRIGTPTEELQRYTSKQDGITYCEFPGAGFKEGWKTVNKIRTCGKQYGAKALIFTVENPEDCRLAIARLAILLPSLNANLKTIMPSIFFVFTKKNGTNSKLLKSLKAEKKTLTRWIKRLEADKKKATTATQKCKIENEIGQARNRIGVFNYILKQKEYQQNNIVHLNDPTNQDPTKEALHKKIKQAKPINCSLFSPNKLSSRYFL